MIGRPAMSEQEQLFILLLRMAVAGSFASMLVRFTAFQRMLMREERTVLQRIKLALSLAAAFGAGVATRVLSPAYQAADLGLEGSLLSGLVGGYLTGLVAGILISLPAVFEGKLMSLLLFAAVGVLGGLLRDLAPDEEAIWRLSPFLDLSFGKQFRARFDLRRTAFQLLCLLIVVLAEMLRLTVANLFGAKGVFSLAQVWGNPKTSIMVAIYVSAAFAVILPLKIWNNSRYEKKLETQQLRLNEARLAALTSQINPHFLFNTLNSVSALIRTNPEQARNVVYKLSSILRRLLRKTENLTLLRDELSFIDNYMAIELVRFGDQLKYVQDIEPDTLDRVVPSMMLQPIIENSIRHGLSSKVDGGMIRVRSRWSGEKLHILVEDDGVGIPEANLATLFEQGIGISNVNERLKVLFGDEYRMWVESKPGEGTRTGIEIPAPQRSLIGQALSTAS
jgi:two-component system LytT family sensor kinase